MSFIIIIIIIIIFIIIIINIIIIIIIIFILPLYKIPSSSKQNVFSDQQRECPKT